MQPITECYIQDPSQYRAGNGQPLREALLRLAVKYCEAYATDILYIIEEIEGKLQNDFNLDIYFRQYGVDWPDEPESYRYHGRITRVKDLITESRKSGNC